MYKVNMTDGNISSVLEDMALLQTACNNNSMALVKAAFSKYGLVLNKEGAYDIAFNDLVIKVNNISPIVFQDGYYVDPLVDSLTLSMPAFSPADIYISIDKFSNDGVFEPTVDLISVAPDTAPMKIRAIRLYRVQQNGFVLSIIKDYREENAAILERNPYFTKSAPVISTVTTAYNYDSMATGKDFTHVNQRVAFMMIKWGHASDCSFITRICPCNANGIEEKTKAEYILSFEKALMFEVIDGKMYTIQILAKDVDGSSPWSDPFVFIAGSDRAPSTIDPPQIKASILRSHPTVIGVSVNSGSRSYPYYIEVYKNDTLLYTGPDSTVPSILNKDEFVFYKARVKGPNESMSEMATTGFFEGTEYNPDFNGQPSSLILSVPISITDLVGRPTYDTLYKIQTVMLPTSDIVKLTFDSKGSYATAASPPDPTIAIEVSKADYSACAAVDISDIFIGDGAQIDNHLDYYKFFSSEDLDHSVDPDEDWILNIRINTDQGNTSFNITGTLHIHYKLKNSWLA